MIKTAARVSILGWNGVERKTIQTEPYDNSIIKVPDWGLPKIGELCLTYGGKIAVVKNIRWCEAKDPFKASLIYYTSAEERWISESMVHRIVVKKGKTFTLHGTSFEYLKSNEDDERVDINEVIRLTNEERRLAIPLLNEAYKKGEEDCAPLIEYYKIGLGNDLIKRPEIQNPYKGGDVSNYALCELESTWESAFKKTEDRFIKANFFKG